jgi:hypothetical protein
LWRPGVGPDAEALRHLEEHFRMPAQPMGEAWFMGERWFYTDLLDKDSGRWSQGVIQSAVNSLASGPGCFGPRQEWTDWLHFLIPRLLPRIEDWQWANVYESLVTAFMAQYPDECAQYPYDDFLDDILATLGRVPMSAANWGDGELAELGVIQPIEITPNGPFLSCGGALSAALFLHLKYLDEGLIPTWLASVLAIKDPVWQFKVVMWVAQSKVLLLNSGKQPFNLKYETDGGAGWHDCWCLFGSNPSPAVDPSQVALPFLSDGRKALFRGELQRRLTRASLEDLDAKIAEMQQRLPEIYGVRVLLDLAAHEVAEDYQLS